MLLRPFIKMSKRTSKIIQMCKWTDNKSDFWSKKKDSNWFCNRDLPPGASDIYTSTIQVEETANQNSTEILMKPSQFTPTSTNVEVLGTDLENSVLIDMQENNCTEVTKTKDQNVTNDKFEEEEQIGPYGSENPTNTSITFQDKSKKIIIHDVTAINPPILLRDVTNIRSKSIDYTENKANLESTKTNEIEYELSPSSPEDPFYNSGSSEYHPSDEEENLDISTSPRVTRNRKKEEKTASQSTTQNLVQRKHNTSTVAQTLHKNPCNSKTPYKRKPDHCYYCECEVQNFARHVKRNHSLEIDVAEILSKPNNSKERRILLNKLRRKGNFLASGNGQFKAVRRLDIPGRSLLPCDNCLGFFSSKLLYRHRKKCFGDNHKIGKSQLAGQSKLVTKKTTDKRLVEEVFPHMRADKVSLEAKNDTLICAFGARYINTHREKHFVAVTSRKMRELSKILIEMRKLDPGITHMFSALEPRYFDCFVKAVKCIAKYDAEKDIYLSPTFAMNIVTSLKQCCDIAITYAYKKTAPYSSVSSGEVEANIKILIHLFGKNWRFEISSQAASNLNLNKWNKVTIIPLAADLKLLRTYLITLADDAIKELNENKSIEAYNSLIESVYCRVMLLNRKRSGELQRMPLHVYENSKLHDYKEFNNVVSPTEQILLKSLKRIVIRGKRGRGVPILFSCDVQEHIKTLLRMRDHFVPKENTYFFAKSKSLTHLIGYKILHKHVIRSGAKEPSAITSTRLRKHLATLSQLFNLSENEIEQLATFMGHTPGVHRNSYRLPDDVYQTTKISKLLLILEKGGDNECKGKSLDEVDINMEQNLLEFKADESDNDSIIEDVLPDPDPISTSTTTIPAVDTLQHKKHNHRTLVPWTKKQKDVTISFFKDHINKSYPPKRGECEKLKKIHPELMNNKDWPKIKVFVQNQYLKKKK